MQKPNTNLNKKGNIFDYIEVGRVILVIAVLGFLSWVVLSNVSTGIDTANVSNINYTGTFDKSNDRLVGSLDWVALLFVIVALIFSVISARKIPTEPLYVAIVLFVSFIFFLISFVISNVFGALMDNVTFSNFINLQMPIAKILLQYFPFVTGIYLGIVLIAFFSKDDIGI